MGSCLRSLALCAVLVTGCQSTSEARLQYGDELQFRRDYAGAARVYESVILAGPDSSDGEEGALKTRALLSLARLRHHFLDDADGALRAYRSVAERAPGTPEAFEARRGAARLLRDRLGAQERALAELAALVEAFPARPEIPALRLELATLAFRARHYDVAEREARWLVSATDASLRTEARLLLGSTLDLSGRAEEALAVFGELLASPIDPATEARARLEIGMCLERLGRFTEALAAYERGGADGHELLRARADRVRAKVSRRL